jgi:hypothetical protein
MTMQTTGYKLQKVVRMYFNLGAGKPFGFKNSWRVVTPEGKTWEFKLKREAVGYIERRGAVVPPVEIVNQ